MLKSVRIPPDGGYGWVVVFCGGLSSFVVLSLIQTSGLIFKDIFADMELSATQGSLIMTMNSSFGKIIGPITALVLKYYGCRVTGLLAGFFLTVGMIFTSLSYTFATFFVSYGLVTSLGIQINELAQRLALNLYFNKKRNVAMGYAVTFAGFGPILVPQVIRFLLKVYSPQEVMLIYGGFCSHLFLTAVLLQPVKRHMKSELVEVVPEERELLEKPTRSNTLVKIFDLDLLKDPIFDNILIGLALATFAELNFTLLLPFMLNDLGLSTDQIAVCLSTLAVADMAFRFLGPYIGNYFTTSSRLMYAYALSVLVVIRFVFLWSRDYYVVLVVVFIMGIAKGVRKVYMWLVIPDHVSREKLPAAGGIETLANGTCILLGGPALGFLRDFTGSYYICVVAMNCVTITTIVLWTLEAIVRYKRRTRNPPRL